MLLTRPIPRPIRRIMVHFAAVVCPPEAQTSRRLGPWLAEFTGYLGALPTHLRLGLLVLFVLFDQGARLYRPARGRRFVDLPPVRAAAYFAHLMQNVRTRTLAQLLKGLVTLCYYELPAVQAAIGYRPGPYVAAVARRRWATYAEDIRRGEAAVFAPDAGEAAAPEVTA